MTPETLNNLTKDAKSVDTKSKIQGTPWYNMLIDPVYCDSFGYYFHTYVTKDGILRRSSTCMVQHIDDETTTGNDDMPEKPKEEQEIKFEYTQLLVCLPYFPEDALIETLKNQGSNLDDHPSQRIKKSIHEYLKAQRNKGNVVWGKFTEEDVKEYENFIDKKEN